MMKIPSGPFAAYIFDCDGTLADSMGLHFEAWTYALRRHQAPFEFTKELFRSLAGVGHLHTVEKFNRDYHCQLDPERVIADKERWMWENLEQVQSIEPVVAFLETVWEKYPCAVASGGERKTVRHIVNCLGLTKKVKTIVTQEDVEKSKPAPDLFLLAARRLGVEPEQCLVFEDSTLGIAAAIEAGMDWVQVPGRF